MSVLNSISSIISSNQKIIIIALCLIYFVFVIFIAFYIQKRKQIVSDEILRSITEEKENTATGAFEFEKTLFSLLNIKLTRKTLVTIRVCALIFLAVSIKKLSFVALFLIAEVLLILYDISSNKKLEQDIGISYVDTFNKFMDIYIPAINSGTSVDQAMLNFIQKVNDPTLVEWWYKDDKSVVPSQWADIIAVYNAGKYSEANGFATNTDTFQRDITQRIKFFNLFQEKLNEAAPISYCYYLAVPGFLFMSLYQFPDFWNSAKGLIVVLLIAIFAVFILLSKNNRTNVCKKLF